MCALIKHHEDNNIPQGSVALLVHVNIQIVYDCPGDQSSFADGYRFSQRYDISTIRVIPST